jgi:hypothetical protein
LPLFDPASSSNALTPLIFIMVITLFVMIVNNLSWIGSWLSVGVCVLFLFWLSFLWSSAECDCGPILLLLVGVLYWVRFPFSLAGLFPFCFSVSTLLLGFVLFLGVVYMWICIVYLCICGSVYVSGIVYSCIVIFVCMDWRWVYAGLLRRLLMSSNCCR